MICLGCFVVMSSGISDGKTSWTFKMSLFSSGSSFSWEATTEAGSSLMKSNLDDFDMLSQILAFAESVFAS